ncbi:methyltransferase domain-containing protein [Rhizobium sp. BE258]|jgi:cyclopropane fatty-acyl-phospholipid synthase-like methyltransferase|uniref:SAM-dependent methyltransferase n=1 Tax=Rhizobium sp. BE258 TaxID=2817722 RepID=UPI0028562952|nr:methyltransferase domain-containing protein [Rhizobium sp. BE258]MDR7145499.1 cyclopropane fatty-acyl-phospholipid synthase-like methyltransferase [Rhizobium sp. BE258]
MSSSHYAHGSSEAEQQRLTALNRRLNGHCLNAAQLVAGERVVDFGAGLGQYSRLMARATGVTVLGLERSPEQIAEADGETALLEMRQADALDPPFGDERGGSTSHMRDLS